MKIRLQRVRKSKKTVKWNINNFKKPEIKNAFRTRLDKQLLDENIVAGMEIGEIWKKLKEGIATVAEEICGKEQLPKKQNWMNSEILCKMEERRKCKNMKEEQYKKLKHEMQSYDVKPKTNIMKTSARKLKCWIKHIVNYCTRKLKNYDRKETECYKLLRVNRARPYWKNMK